MTATRSWNTKYSANIYQAVNLQPKYVNTPDWRLLEHTRPPYDVRTVLLLWKISYLRIYQDILVFVFVTFDFLPIYGIFSYIFFGVFGYFMSVNELQVTRFDPGNYYFENMIFRTISRNIFKKT